MKVIKDNYHKTADITCWKCNSLLQITPDDVMETLSGNFVTECPLCNSDIYISKGIFIK